MFGFIFSGTVLVQQLMAVLIGRHDVLFPRDEDEPTLLELANNNNIELPKRQATTTTSPIAAVSQNAENNNNTQVGRQCAWEAPESHSNRQQVDNRGSSRSASPRNVFDMTRSPPLTIKKNPAFSKGSGIVTNGSFSSSPSSDPTLDKNQITMAGGNLPVRRSGTLKGSGTKMGTSGVTSGGTPAGNGTGILRVGVSGSDGVAGSLNNRNGLWVQNGCVMLRENNKTRHCSSGDQTASQNRLSTYDNVQLNHQNLHNQTTNTCLSTSCEDKQSVDSATWSTSSCEISLPDNSNSCRSSTTTCPEHDFYSGHYEDLDGPVQDCEPHQTGGGGGEESGGSNNGEGDGAGGSSRGTSSSEPSESFTVGNGPGSHSALHSLVASLKQEMHKQKSEYEARIKR